MTAYGADEEGRVPVSKSAPDETSQSSQRSESASFYSAFEERFRGTREDIARRQSIYLPILEKAGILGSDAPILDIGCGRGEWLELLEGHGCRARGVDLNENFVDDCRRRGFDVLCAEASGFLRCQPAETYAAVTLFHLIEHLPFAQMREVIMQIHRVLRPGGIMIVETPNPENITVGSCNFYSDPTHLTPIPPSLLQFMTEQAGFPTQCVARVNADRVGVPIMYLPPEAPYSLQINAGIYLLNQNYYVSPDYSVIAQKDGGIISIIGSEELNRLCEQAPMDITHFRQSEAEAKAQEAEAKARAAEAKAQAAEAKAQAAEAKAQAAEAKAQAAEAKAEEAEVKTLQAEAEARIAEAKAEDAEVKTQQAEAKAQVAEAKAQMAEAKAQQAEAKAQEAETKAQEAEAKAQQAEHLLLSMMLAKSWRITAPLRTFKRLFAPLIRSTVNKLNRHFLQRSTKSRSEPTSSSTSNNQTGQSVSESPPEIQTNEIGTPLSEITSKLREEIKTQKEHLIK